MAYAHRMERAVGAEIGTGGQTFRPGDGVGSVGRVVVVKSLDSTFGLDQQAVKAARQWHFAPGRRLGEPVAVLVIIDLEFRLR